MNKSSYLGVDIEESRENSYLGYICLIQIATEDNVFLIDTISLRKEILDLKPIFTNTKIVKIFHGSYNDTQWLFRDFGIICVNVFDTYLAAIHLGLKKHGLNYLWEQYCNYIMASEYKKKMQTSRWDTRPLTKEQIVYGAQDAQHLIYLMQEMMKAMSDEHILSMRIQTNKICKKQFSLEINEDTCMELLKKHSNQAIDSQTRYIFLEIFRLRDKLARELNCKPNMISPIETLVSLSFEKPTSSPTLNTYPKCIFLERSKIKILAIITQGLSIDFEILREHKLATKSRKEKKQERYQVFLDKYTIKKKVYENCQIQAPDGEILCFADSKKANWYVERSLAEVIQISPLIIRLNFEPNGRGFSDVEADQMYYSKEKKNECVSCGSTSTYLKYHVVPLLYRQYFPDNHKNHRSHDIVLLCAVCHETANKQSDILKKQIAEEYGIPLKYFSEMRKIKDELNAAKKLSVSIVRNGKSMPEARAQILLQEVSEFVKNNEKYSEYLKGKDLDFVVAFLSREENCRILLGLYGQVNWRKELGNSHGKLIVEKLTDLKAFIRRWRAHFIESLQPKYLPDSWNVEHLLNSPKFQ